MERGGTGRRVPLLESLREVGAKERRGEMKGDEEEEREARTGWIRMGVG
jgi:hypothetical protein